jgi:hypothetical protein
LSSKNSVQFKISILRKLVVYILPVAIPFFMISCKTDAENANDVLNTAMRMEEAQGEHPAQEDGKLLIQNSAYTDPVKKVPTQEELIKMYKVKTVKEIYSAGWTLSTYDNKGNLISTESDGLSKHNYSYVFDTKGRVIKETRKLNDIAIVKEFEYNADGKLIRESFTPSDEKTEVTTYEYDKKLKTRTETSSTGVEKEFYDNRGLRVRFESYGEKGDLMSYGEAKYDEKGLKVSEKSSLLGKTMDDVYQYNENGQVISLYRTGPFAINKSYEYNRIGLMISSRTTGGYAADESTYEYTFYE